MIKQRNDTTVLTRYYLGDCYEMDVTPDASKERLYLGGDYYSAPAVLIRDTQTGIATVYHILRDQLGSITHVTDSYGHILQELSYDAWGRLRNPDTHVVYAPDSIPELFLGRGYTGHEHLNEFGLINMNARLYDPVLGRFLSPDKYVQESENSQNFNRYSYCLNNPLKYKDENGEFFFTIFNFITDGIINLVKHGFNVSSYNWTRTNNSIKIDLGLFKGSFKQVVNKWTWGLVNSLGGNVTAHLYNTIGKVDHISFMDGAIAVSGPTGKDTEKAFTIGPYIMGPKGLRADWRDHLFVHEYGHYAQSQLLGPLYLGVVALPSLTSTLNLGGDNHETRWFEVNASYLGARHFDRKYGRGAQGYKPGDPNYFDIDAFSTGNPTLYYNIRNGNNTVDGKGISNPIYNPRHSVWDYIIPLFFL